MTWSLYVDGELYCKTCNYSRTLTIKKKLEYVGYVLIHTTETSRNNYMWEFRLA